MKKLLLSLAIAAVSLSGSSASVGAVNSGSVSDTGTDSINTIEAKEDFTCIVENENNFVVKNNNNQDAASGSAAVSGNTSGGAKSGSATNSNGTVIDVTIDNSGGCVVTAVKPPAPVVPGAGDEGNDNGGNGGSQPVGGMGAVRPVGGMKDRKSVV